MKKSLIVIFAILMVSCNSKKEICKGNLYFKLIDIGSFYGETEEKIREFERKIDSFKIDSKTSKDDADIINKFKTIKRLNLFRIPCIRVQTSDDIKLIFLSESEYKKVKSFTLEDLKNRGKKVILELELEELDKGIYYSENIIKVQEIDGQTPWKK
ncbi:hypothetical protein [Flavobacterium sp.]|uniref:hypothetical protein n=1 Tax=Flavobacterium sp. TaxID=239 RepID=UPI002606F6D8|nr:hypothetical protein [Flavobacterium sp.]